MGLTSGLELPEMAQPLSGIVVGYWLQTRPTGQMVIPGLMSLLRTVLERIQLVIHTMQRPVPTKTTSSVSVHRKLRHSGIHLQQAQPVGHSVSHKWLLIHQCRRTRHISIDVNR